MATQDQLSCLFTIIRKDILPFYASNGWDTSQANWDRISKDWWLHLHGGGPSNDPAYQYNDLESYLISMGCGAQVATPLPPNTSPAPSGVQNAANNPTAYGGSQSPGDQIKNAVAFAQKNPLYVGLAAGLIFLILYQPPQVTFTR